MRFIEKYSEVVIDNRDRLAVDDGTCSLTYGQLDERASKVYAYLKGSGISKEDFVMVLLPRGVNTVAAILGVFKAGAAVIPMEDTYPGDRIEFIKKDTDCKLVIDSKLIEEIYETMDGLEDYEETDLHDAAYAIYTSGSTGSPKGVLHEYGNLDQAMESEYDENDTHRIYGFIPPFYFVASMMALVGKLASADSVYIISQSMLRDFAGLKSFILEKKIGLIYLPPSYIRLYTDPSPYLKTVVTGSEPANGIYYPGGVPRIINSYSMSEAGFAVLRGGLDKKYDVAPVGKPVLNIPYHLIDEEGNEIEGEGQGELCFLNEYVRGYINLPEKTAAAWKDGVYHTGDIVRRDSEGVYYVVGRNDDMIKINGNRIEPAEIEARVQELTGLKKVIAKGFASEERSYICVYYIKKEALELGIETDGKLEIDSERLKKILPSYMIPAYYVGMESFPINANGKIAKKELKSPDVSDYVSEYIAPENELEEYFCEKMAEVLKAGRFSATADFFEMGGDSIKAITLTSKCIEHPITTNLLYRFSTPRLLAQNYVVKESTEDLDRQNAEAIKGRYKLLPGQLLHLIHPSGHGYNDVTEITSLYKLKTGTDIDRFRNAVDHVLKCHPALSTRLEECGVNIYQQFDESVFEETAVKIVDEEEFSAYLEERYRKTEELFGTKLYTSEILKCGNDYYFYCSLNHLIADGASNRILIDDISRRYLDEKYEPGKDYWFLVLKRYWENEPEDKDDSVIDEPVNEYKWYHALVPDRDSVPIKGKMEVFPNAFVHKEESNGVYFATACLLAQCWYKKENRSSLLSVFNNREESINVDAFGMISRGLMVSLTIEEGDTPSSLIKKVQKEFSAARNKKGPSDQLNDLGDLLKMMRFNFLFNMEEEKTPELFSQKIPIKVKRENIIGSIATNIVAKENNDDFMVVYSTDVFDEESIERYKELFYEAVEFLDADKSLKEINQKALIEKSLETKRAFDEEGQVVLYSDSYFAVDKTFANDPAYASCSVFTLKEEIDGKRLFKSVNEAAEVYPYVQMGIEYRENEVLRSFVKNTKPILVFEGEQNIQFGSEENNGHHVLVCYSGSVIKFYMSHVLTDGYGMNKFINAVLKNYVLGQRCEDDMLAQSDFFADLMESPLQCIRGSTLKDYHVDDCFKIPEHDDIKKACHYDTIAVERTAFKRFCSKMKLSEQLACNLLMAMAIQKVHPENLKKIVTRFPINTREIFGIPNAFSNASVPHVFLKVEPDDIKNQRFDAVSEKLRDMFEEQYSYNNMALFTNRMASRVKCDDQSVIAEDFKWYKSHSQILTSYLGDMISEDLADEITKIEMSSTFAAYPLMMYAINLKDVTYFQLIRDFESDAYSKALKEILNDLCRW